MIFFACNLLPDQAYCQEQRGALDFQLQEVGILWLRNLQLIGGKWWYTMYILHIVYLPMMWDMGVKNGEKLCTIILVGFITYHPIICLYRVSTWFNDPWMTDVPGSKIRNSDVSYDRSHRPDAVAA